MVTSDLAAFLDVLALGNASPIHHTRIGTTAATPT